MKLLDGRDIASFITQRHVNLAASLAVRPRLAIIRSADNEAGDKYLKMKRQYGHSVGVDVDVYIETADTILERIDALNSDTDVTGIIVQLPLTGTEVTDQALAAIAPAKDVDGLGPDSPFEAATPKAILWLLAAHNVDLMGNITVVGQGRLIGKPLADRIEASGRPVVRCDIHTHNLAAATLQADILVVCTGRKHLITPGMVKEGAVIIDTGSPSAEVDPAIFGRIDLTVTPNPGGVGPMTVIALFDNLLIAAQNRKV